MSCGNCKDDYSCSPRWVAQGEILASLFSCRIRDSVFRLSAASRRTSMLSQLWHQESVQMIPPFESAQHDVDLSPPQTQSRIRELLPKRTVRSQRRVRGRRRKRKLHSRPLYPAAPWRPGQKYKAGALRSVQEELEQGKHQYRKPGATVLSQQPCPSCQPPHRPKRRSKKISRIGT